MPRTKGSKNKKPTIKKVVKQPTKTKQTQKQSQTVHVHLEKPKTRKTRTTKPKEQSTPLQKPSNSISSSVRSGLIHTRGQINNEVQQPSIIQQVINPDIEKMIKRLDLIDNKMNSPSSPNINISTPQPNINITTNKSKQPASLLTSDNVAKHKSVIRLSKSVTRKGTLFKPSDLDETGSVLSLASNKSIDPAASLLLTPDPTAPEVGQKGPAVTSAERLAKHAALKPAEEKKLENRLYSLKGTGSKKGAISTAEERLRELQAETPSTGAQKKTLQKRIEKLKQEIVDLKTELSQVETDLKLVRSTKPGEKRGRRPALTATP